MMMEQQIALKNDEMQEKWKNCIQVTCYVLRTYEVLKDYYDRLLEAINLFLESVKRAFSNMFENLSEAFKVFKEVIDDCDFEPKKCKSYPHSFPHYVDNLKLNTRGFPQPVIKCARSRC